ncbi:MAG: hypothetical protein QXS54_09585, partial [Candidatus Methanomethylicaceae archaeon]
EVRNRWRSVGLNSLVHSFVPRLPLFLLSPLGQQVDCCSLSPKGGLGAILESKYCPFPEYGLARRRAE